MPLQSYTHAGHKREGKNSIIPLFTPHTAILFNITFDGLNEVSEIIVKLVPHPRLIQKHSRTQYTMEL